MKNKYNIINKFLIVVLISFIGQGCGEEFLTQYPQDQLTAGTFYKTDKDFIAAANGIYDGGIQAANTEFMCFLDMATPFADCAGGRFNVYQMRRTNGVIDVNDNFWGSGVYWPLYYNTISRANIVLANLENEDSEASEAIIKRTEGEALFLRAFAYFNLTHLFGDVPLITSILPYEEVQVPNTPKAQVVAQIIADLTRAQELLPSAKDYRGTSEIGRASKGAAQSLLGKMYLYSEDWSNAETWFDKVIASGDYELEPYYVDMFWPSGENGMESIFEIQYKVNDPGDRNRLTQYIGFHNNSNTYWTGGWFYIHPTQYYVDQFETVNGYKVESQFVSREGSDLIAGGFNFNYNYSSSDPSYDANDPHAIQDPRLKWTVWYDDTPYIEEDYNSRSATTGANFNRDYSKATNHCTVKYMTGKLDPQDHTGMNMIVIRYADVLLMAAEAKLEQNKLDPAVALINQVRDRVGMPGISAVEAAQGVSIASDQSSLRYYMRAERYRELAFEWGHIYYDQIRWKIFDDEMESFWVDGRDGHTFPSLVWNDRYWLWPIPGGEMGRNENLTQNSGY